MNKCLVTKLAGIVDNDSLMKVGEFSISVNSVKSPTQKSQSFIIRNSNNCVLRIVGDGYFTDETLAANKGKSLAVNAGIQTTVYFSNGDYDIYISDKYSINLAEFYSCSINLDDFKYSYPEEKQNIKKINRASNLDIETLKKNLMKTLVNSHLDFSKTFAKELLLRREEASHGIHDSRTFKENVRKEACVQEGAGEEARTREAGRQEARGETRREACRREACRRQTG